MRALQATQRFDRKSTMVGSYALRNRKRIKAPVLSLHFMRFSALGRLKGTIGIWVVFLPLNDDSSALI